MNRTKIEWCDFSWNPVTGCLHGCWYCYAEKLTKRFPKVFPRGFQPTFHYDRLTEPWKTHKAYKIFVCSIADLFAPWTPREWMEAVVKYSMLSPVKHTFQFLTKNPERIPRVKYPENFWMGTTVTNENQNADWGNIDAIKKVKAGVRFGSFEPLLGDIPSDLDGRELEGLDWIIIGKLTGSRKVKLDPAWVWEILEAAQMFNIPVFMKNNLKPEFPGVLIQQFPGPAPGLIEGGILERRPEGDS